MPKGSELEPTVEVFATDEFIIIRGEANFRATLLEILGNKTFDNATLTGEVNINEGVPGEGASLKIMGEDIMELMATHSKINNPVFETAITTPVLKLGIGEDVVEVTASAAELNTLDGILATTEELNTLAGAAGGSMQEAVDSKLPHTNPTVFGTLSVSSPPTTGTVSFQTKAEYGIPVCLVTGEGTNFLSTFKFGDLFVITTLAHGDVALPISDNNAILSDTSIMFDVDFSEVGETNRPYKNGTVIQGTPIASFGPEGALLGIGNDLFKKYQAKTWWPSIYIGNATGSPAIIYNNYSLYTLIGNLCFFSLHIQLVSNGGLAGAISIALPLNAESMGTDSNAAKAGVCQVWLQTASATPLPIPAATVGIPTFNANGIGLLQILNLNRPSYDSQLRTADLTNGATIIYASGHYRYKE